MSKTFRVPLTTLGGWVAAWRKDGAGGLAPKAPGTFGTLAAIPEAIVVPSGAVIPDISGESVIVCRGGKARFVPVKTGVRTDRGTQITEGLAAGDTLVLTGLLQLTDGKPVLVRGLGTDAPRTD